MVTRENHLVTALVWLSFMYSELPREIAYSGNIILEIQRQKQNPCHLTPDTHAAHKLALHYQGQLYKSHMVKHQDVHCENYLRFEATCKQFTGEVQLGMQYLALTMD